MASRPCFNEGPNRRIVGLAAVFCVLLFAWIAGCDSSPSEPPPLTVSILISESSVAFDSVTVGQEKFRDITITNAPGSSGTLTGTVRINGSGFSIVSSGGSFSLSPGQSRAVTVRFAPSAAASYSGVVSISHNGTSSDTPISLALTGTGTPATGSIQGVPSSIDFGTIVVGQTADSTFTIQNAANADGPLTWDLGLASSWFSLIGGVGSVSLAPGTSRSVTVRYAPTSSGAHSGSLSVTHDGSNAPSPLLISLSGIAAQSIQIDVSPTDHDFSTVVVGQNSEHRFNLSNPSSSDGPLQGTITIQGSGFSEGTHSGGDFSIDPGRAATFDVRFTPTAEGVHTGLVTITHNATNVTSPLALPISGTGREPGVLTLTTTSLPDATVGQTYEQTLSAEGGTTPYEWVTVSGSLPGGLSLSRSGAITGTPTIAGTSSFTVRVTDANGLSDTQEDLSITVYVSAIDILPDSLPPGATGIWYLQFLSATGGTPPFRWNLINGSLPAGLSMDTSGEINGRPDQLGTRKFVIEVSVSDGRTVSKDFSITVVGPEGVPAAPVPYSPAPGSTITDDPPFFDWSEPEHAAGYEIWICEEEFSCSTHVTLDESEYTPPSSLPPSITGTYLWAVRARNDDGVWGDGGGEWWFIIAEPVPEAPILLTPTSGSTLTDATVFFDWSEPEHATQYYLYIRSSSRGTFSLLDTSETTREYGDGTYYWSVRAGNSQNIWGEWSDSLQFSVEVSAPGPIVTTNSLPNGTVGVTYDGGFSAEGGETPYTWSLDSGSLPNGLVFGTETGVISGTPTTTGTSNFDLRVTDVNGLSDTKALSITVNGQDTCTYSVLPTSASFTSLGGTGTVSITARSGCDWTAESSHPAWLSITSGAGGSGSGTVYYSLIPNVSQWIASPRTITITIANRSVSVTQDAFNTGDPTYRFSANFLTAWISLFARYGNWCGASWSGGENTSFGRAMGTGDPVDLMDLACKAHDLGYQSADQYWEPIYDAASGSAQAQACSSWKADRRDHDGILVTALINLPALDTTNTKPDTWKYDPRLFDLTSHPWDRGTREDFRALVVGYFTDHSGLPPC